MSSDTMQLLASNDINTAETELINSHHNLASTTASTPINLPKASPLPPILNNESNSLLKHIEDLHLHHISRNHNHTMTPATAQSNEIDALVMGKKKVKWRFWCDVFTHNLKIQSG